MKGDFSRFLFNSQNNYLSVLKQQGRIDLDSDWNEQAEIWNELFRQLISDIIGDFGVPLAPNDISSDNSTALMIKDFSLGRAGVFDFSISKGLAYVGGYPFKLARETTFRNQLNYPEPENPQLGGDLLAFIEVWRQSISYIDDDIIREPALGGPDTSLRTRLIGQVKVVAAEKLDTPQQARDLLESCFKPSNLQLTLQIDYSGQQIPISFGDIDMSGGMIPGNLHYRLEYHCGMTSNGNSSEGIKWSDENASVLARVIKPIDAKTLLVEELEPITGESLKPGDWIEVSNTVTELNRRGGQMAQIQNLESGEKGSVVTLDTEIHPLLARLKMGGRPVHEQNLTPRLRRWSGFITPLTLKNVYDLGRGVKAVFNSPEKKYTIEPSDYWAFAVRDKDYNKRYSPQKALPSGIKKYRHPLAIIKLDSKQNPTIIDCRKFVKPLSSFGIA